MYSTWIIIITYFAYNICLLVATGIIGLACVIGLYRQTRSAHILSPFTLFLYAIGLGFPALITILFTLALFGQLTKVLIFSAIFLSVLLAGIYLIKNREFFAQQLSKIDLDTFEGKLYYLSLGGTIIVALFTLLTNVHVTGFSDSTAYHLPYARFYLENRGLAVNVDLRYPYHSHNGNLLYSLALTFADSIYCQTLHGLFGILTALVIFSFAISAGVAAPLAMLASSGFLSLEIFIRQSAVADVDIFLVFFTTMSIYTVILWGKDKSDRVAFIISAVCLGMAMGTKYLGALHAFPIAIFIIYHTRSIRQLLFYAAISALFGSWWYIRSFLMTGNPVHPFASNIFGYYLWNEADFANQMQGLSGFVDKNFKNFITLPVVFDKESFAFTGMQYWLYGFYFAPLFWPRLSSTSKSLMLFSWPFLAFWFYTSHIWRYIIPLAPLVIIISCDLVQISLNQLYKITSRYHKSPLLLESVIIGLTLGYIAQQTVVHLGKVKKTASWAITAEQQNIYLRKYNHEYDLIAEANRYFSKDQQVFLFCCFDKTYFLNARGVGEHFGAHRASDLLSPLRLAFNKNQPDKTALELLNDKFASLHIDGFIIDKNNIPSDQQLLDTTFEKLYSNRVGSIYRINR